MKKTNQKMRFWVEIEAVETRSELIGLNNEIEKMVNDKHREVLTKVIQGWESYDPNND